METKFFSRKAAALVAAASLAFTGLAGLAVPESPFVSAAAASTQPSSVMPSNGTLTIHKYDDASVGTAGDGTELSPAPTGTALAGVQFDVYAVLGADGQPLNLNEQADWAEASKVTIQDLFTNVGSRAVDTSKAERVTTLTTGPDGTTKSDSLEPRLYLVVEKPNQKVDGKTVVPAQPFLVTVPLTNPDGTGWISDVHVYPKNATIDPESSAMGLTKTISDPVPTVDGVNVTGSSKGEQITYTLSATAPKLPGDNNYDGFVVADKLPAGISTAAENVVVTVNGQPAEEGTYTTEVRNDGGQSVVVVNFAAEDAGSSTLSGATISVAITGTVADVTTGASGVKSNTGYFYPGYLDTAAGTWDPSTDSNMLKTNAVKSVYGQINITKVDSGDQSKLQGAEFQLYRCAAGETTGDALRFGREGATTFTTDDQGAATIAGIHLGNVDANNTYTSVWGAQGDTFCLVETKAPEGYAVQPKPIPVSLTANAGTSETVVATADVENVKTNAGFTLPLTGGVGLWLIIGAGVVLIIISIVYRARKNS